MMISRKSQLLVALITAYVFSAAYPQQQEQPKRQLQFEVSTKPVGLTDRYPKVTHVGDIHISHDRKLTTWVLGVSETSQWKGMSEEQQHFVSKLQDEYRALQSAKRTESWDTGMPFSANSDYVRTPAGIVTYRVLGVSEEDTRKMAGALIEWLDNKANGLLKNGKKDLEYNLQIVGEAEKILPELEAKFYPLKAKADKKIKEYTEAKYGIISNHKISEDARKSMEEFAHCLRLVDFEFIGLQAKIDSINKFKGSEEITDQNTLLKLDQMLIAAEVELAGVLARKNAYETAFNQAKELRDAVLIVNKVSGQIEEWQKKFALAQKRVLELKKMIASPPSKMRPVEVYENKVVIRQVKQ